jgi:ferredoxin
MALQVSLLLFSIILIAVGIWGPQFAPKNIATLFIWVHYRGFLVLALLIWGNIFCMSCPFIFARDCLRIFIKPKFLWPKKLQNKWTAMFLFCAVLFYYEYMSLWSSPYKTALLIIAFFVLAMFTDTVFKKASFCKYVCPIGQFNFLASTLSPKEVKAKSLSVCESCKTQDCLRGNKELNLRGCETHLLMPRKKGNLDCTFCMDCVQACPYENIHIASVVPGSELWQETHRSGIGLLSSRKDFLAFIIAFTFGALVNAFLMTGPANIIKENFVNLGIQSDFFILLFFFFIALTALPAILLFIPEWLSQKQTGQKYKLIPTLLPVGFAVWIAHYSFHLLSGLFTFVPLISNFDLPVSWMGLNTSVITPIQLGVLVLGFLGSILVSIMLSENKKVQIAWITMNLVITCMAVWIMILPMDMRGTFVGIGQ